MNSKERVLATINFEPVDRPAVFPLEGSGWICNRGGYSYAQQFEMPDCGAADLVKGFEDMRSDAIFCGGSAWMAWANAFGSPVDASNLGAPINVGPAFNLAEPIPEFTDEEIEEKLRNNYYVKAMVRQIKAVKELIGDEKVIMSGHTGPFTGAAVLAGTNDFMKLVARKKPIVNDLLNLAARTLAIYAGILREAGTDIVNICDPVSSGDMISMKTYEAMAVPAMETYLSNLKEKDMPKLMHICGNAGSRVEHVRDFGVKCFSVDTMVDMEDMLKRCDHKMCMVGNLDNAAIMVSGTPEDVYRESVKLLELGKANGGGLIVCTGCELPYITKLENILAMVKAAEDVYA